MLVYFIRSFASCKILVNDGLMLVNDSEMLGNDGEISMWSYTHFTMD